MREKITALISTSPIWCNPSTEIVDETYGSIRKHLPDVQILLLMDGVHPEQPHMVDRYEGFKAAIKEKPWSNFQAIEFPDWQHQSGMLRTVLLERDLVKTPLVFWTEHDLPLCDAPIQWQEIVDALLQHEVDSVRFDLTGERKPALERGYFWTKTGVPLLRTVQHTAAAQIVRLDYLQQLVRWFGGAKTYYDDGKTIEAPHLGFLSQEGSKEFICSVYAPAADVRRCYHIDGRERRMTGKAGKPYIIEPGGDQKYMYPFPYRPVEKG